MPLSTSSRSVIPRVYIRKLGLVSSKVHSNPLPCEPTRSDPMIYFELDFTGISAPYEAPEKPEIHLKTEESDVADCVRIITEYLSTHGII